MERNEKQTQRDVEGFKYNGRFRNVFFRQKFRTARRTDQKKRCPVARTCYRGGSVNRWTEFLHDNA